MAQRAVSTKDALKHVNKRIGQARGSLRRQISLPVLFGAAGLVAFGCLIIWTASLTISAASFLPMARRNRSAPPSVYPPITWAICMTCS